MVNGRHFEGIVGREQVEGLLVVDSRFRWFDGGRVTIQQNASGLLDLVDEREMGSGGGNKRETAGDRRGGGERGFAAVVDGHHGTRISESTMRPIG